MSTLEDAITKVIKDALADKYASPLPVFADKKTMVQILNTSERTLGRLMTNQTLVEELHYTRFTEGGHPMFAVKKVIEALKPNLANLEDLI